VARCSVVRRENNDFDPWLSKGLCRPDKYNRLEDSEEMAIEPRMFENCLLDDGSDLYCLIDSSAHLGNICNAYMTEKVHIHTYEGSGVGTESVTVHCLLTKQNNS
jgi:hypothetical protein